MNRKMIEQKTTCLVAALFAMVLMLAGTGIVQAGIGDGLISYWPMDEGSGTVAGDKAGGNTGTVHGGAKWTTGKFGSCVVFDGVTSPARTDYIDCGGDASLMPANVSVSAWVKFDAYPYYGQIAGMAFDEGGSESGYSLLADSTWIATNGFVAWITGDNEDGTYSGQTGPAAPIDWTHVAVTYDGTTTTVYVNGVGTTDTTATGDLSYTYVNTFKIGLYQAGAWWLPYEGLIDDVAVWDRALSQADIDHLYNGGTGNTPIVIKKVKPTTITDVMIDETLEWTSPTTFTATGYDVYFGTDPNVRDNPKVVVNVLTNTHDPFGAGDMVIETTYYWAVDTYESATRYDGMRWSFTTVGSIPVILDDPDDQIVEDGTLVAFSVRHVNGTSYEWWKVGGGSAISSGSTTSGATLTLNVSGIQANEGRYYCKLMNAGTPAGVDSASALLMTKRLVSYWTFNNGNNLKDQVGDNHGSSVGPDGVTYAAGKIGRALSLGGGDPNDVVNIPYAEDLNLETYSVALWANATGGSGTYRSPLTSRNDDPQRGYMIYATSSDTWAYWTGLGTGGWIGTGSGNVAADIVENEWVFLTITYDVNTLEKRLYINGELAGQTTLTAPAVLNTDFALRIGGGGNSVNTISYIFNGLIDDVKIWSYALNPFAVAKLYTDVEGGQICVEPDALLYNYDDTSSSWCRTDISDIAVFALKWLDCNIAPDCLGEHAYTLD